MNETLNSEREAAQCRECGSTFEARVTRFPSITGKTLTSVEPVCPACITAADEREKALLLENAVQTIPARFRHFNTAIGRGDVLEKIRNAAQRYPSLYIVGAWGTGKTRAACAVAVEMAKANPSLRVKFCSADEFSAGLNVGKTLAKISELDKCDILIFDDIGVSRSTEFILEATFTLINRRYVAGRRIWVTTNYSPRQLDSRLGDDYGPKIVRRLADMCHLVQI